MSFYELASHLEDPDHIKETTTIDAIAYLPSHVGAVKAAIDGLKQKKKQWNIEVLETDNGKTVRFEDALEITVPSEHWDHFQSMFEGVVNDNEYLSYNEELNEKLNEEEVPEETVQELRRNIKPALTQFYNKEEFLAVDKDLNIWKSRFGVDSFLTEGGRESPLVVAENKSKGIQKLAGEILREYGHDRGNMEMLLESLNEHSPMNSFDVFKDRTYLYGTRVRSTVDGVELILEATVDNLYVVSETIFVNDDEVLDLLEESSDGVKRVGKVIYPKGNHFPPHVFKALEEAVHDSIETGEEYEG